MFLYFSFLFFFFNDTATTEIYTLSLHDALPLSANPSHHTNYVFGGLVDYGRRSEEHTSELQSRENLVCRLLLEKKKKTKNNFRAKKKKNKHKNKKKK